MVAEAIARTVPIAISQVMATQGTGQAGTTPVGSDQTTGLTTTPPDTPSAAATQSRGERFYASESKANISEELLELTQQAFSKSLTRDTWRTLTQNYPEIEGTDTLLGAPAMETGMKEDIRKKHGYNKTKDVFAFDDGLAEKQATFLLTARPILAALSALDQVGEEGDETEAPDPDVIKGMLEDALVFLGNANVRLNSWRQRRFSEYLTEVGKRTLKEEIPSDKHLFPERFHDRIKSEHNHSSSNNNLISQPRMQPRFGARSTPSPQPFRTSGTGYNGAGNAPWRKRRWGPSTSRPHSTPAKRYRPNKPGSANKS
jgi:hypothetical protein